MRPLASANAPVKAAIAERRKLRILPFRHQILVAGPIKGATIDASDIALMITGLLLTSLAACNTVKGVGRDIESVGRAGERAM
jgi:predicted small secreted protein